MNAPNPVLVGLFLADVLDWLAEQEEEVVVDGSLLVVDSSLLVVGG